MEKNHSEIKHIGDVRPLTDEQRKAMEQLIKNSPLLKSNVKEKKSLGYRIGELFSSLIMACVSALLIAITLKLISMILF